MKADETESVFLLFYSNNLSIDWNSAKGIIFCSSYLSYYAALGWSCSIMGSSQLPSIAYAGRINGVRPVGRPRMRWNDNIRDDIIHLQPVGNILDWDDHAQNREVWRDLVRAARGHAVRSLLID